MLIAAKILAFIGGLSVFTSLVEALAELTKGSKTRGLFLKWGTLLLFIAVMLLSATMG